MKPNFWWSNMVSLPSPLIISSCPIGLVEEKNYRHPRPIFVGDSPGNHLLPCLVRGFLYPLYFRIATIAWEVSERWCWRHLLSVFWIWRFRIGDYKNKHFEYKLRMSPLQPGWVKNTSQAIKFPRNSEHIPALWVEPMVSCINLQICGWTNQLSINWRYLPLLRHTHLSLKILQLMSHLKL